MADWLPIESAPCCEPVIVGSGLSWTLAKKVNLATSTLQARWPFIQSGREWVWVFSCSEGRKIDFKPTHWQRVDITPPIPPHVRRPE